MQMKFVTLAAALPLCLLIFPSVAAEGDAVRSSRAFQACAACHSIQADRNMTGPSLAGVWNRKAGSLPSFARYSQTMKDSKVIWDDKTLDAYLKDPAHFMPGNQMIFPGIVEPGARADIIAFLKQPASGQNAAQTPQRQQAQRGGMMGMNRGAPNLKTTEAASRVQSITYCRDTFKVTTADGKTRDFWERNLRFKTDSSDEGPEKDAPAIVSAGMMGDRASVVFASPEEMGRFITRNC
jgi:cytochrome c